MNELFSFKLRCPGCERERVSETCAPGELLRLLEDDYPIEVRCTECGARWPIGPEARVQIARSLQRVFQSTEAAAR